MPFDDDDDNAGMDVYGNRLYLRSKTDGFIFGYSKYLLENTDLEVITEAQAYPERHVPQHVEDAKAKAKPLKVPVPLAAGITPETGTEKEADTDPALAKQAGKGWPQ
jgi:hypothetical protein